LDAGASYDRSMSITLPFLAGYDSGDYYLLLVTDGYDQELEADETNNLIARPIALTLPLLPDIVVSDVTVEATDADGIQAGDRVRVGWTLRNEGAVAASGWIDRIYLNADNILDGSYTRLLGTFEFA